MRGETLLALPEPEQLPISIHSPHARGDDRQISERGDDGKFQSTPLMRGETDIIV